MLGLTAAFETIGREPGAFPDMGSRFQNVSYTVLSEGDYNMKVMVKNAWFCD